MPESIVNKNHAIESQKLMSNCTENWVAGPQLMKDETIS